MAHHLQHKWCLSYLNQEEAAKTANYEDCIHTIATFDTVEDFWKYYSYIKLPSEMQNLSDLHLFRDNYRPVWEADKNKYKGTWYLIVKMEFSDLVWEKSVLNAIGNNFPKEVIGIRISLKDKENKSTSISYWISSDQVMDCKKVAKLITNVMQFPSSTTLTFKNHGEKKSNKTFKVN